MQGRVDEALALFADALERKRELYGGVDARVGHTLHDRALVLERAGRADEARADAEAARAIFDAPDTPARDEYQGAVRLLLGRLCLARGELDAALVEFEQSVEARGRFLGDTDPLLAESRAWFAVALARTRGLAAAAGEWALARAGFAAAHGFDPAAIERVDAAARAAGLE
jgi:tetratricopeptide (TPR) repeat protein